MLVVTEGSELHPHRRAEFTGLAEFLSLDRIVYTDRANKEEILLVKGNKYVKLVANSNRFDGGWLSVEFPDRKTDVRNQDRQDGDDP